MVKPKHEGSLKRKSGSALLKKKVQRKHIDENIWRKDNGDGDTNSSTVPSFAKFPVDNFISPSAKKLKHNTQQK